MPYIPQFNKISLQESAYAPSLMRQKHDEAVSNTLELNDALKFESLKQDTPLLDPILQKYSQDIGKVSEDLAKSGFTQDTKSKILGLRSQFTTDDKIRQVKKNYGDAMSQWDEQRKRMIQEGRPGSDIDNQKNAFFSGYQGAFSKDGFKNDFTAGATSGYHDIAEEAKKAMTNIGENGTLVGNNATIIKTDDFYNPVTQRKEPYYKIVDSKTGEKVDNLTQLQAVQKYLENNYFTKGTDENRFAQINKIDPEYIKNTISGVASSMSKNMYDKIPDENTRIQLMDDGTDGTKKQPLDGDLNQYENLNVNSKEYKEADAREKAIKADVNVPQKRLNLSYGATWGVPPDDEPTPPQPGAYGKTSAQIKQESIVHQNNITPRYLGMNNPNTGNQYTPEEAALEGIKATKNASAYKETTTAMNVDSKSLGGKTPAEVVLMNMINQSSKKPLIQVGGKWTGGDKNISKQDLMNLLEDTNNKGVTWKDAPVQFKNNGDIIISDFNGNSFKLNPTGEQGESTMEKSTSKLYNELYLPILTKITSVNTYDDPKLDAPIQGPDGALYDVVSTKNGKITSDADPYSPENRIVRRRVAQADGTAKSEYYTQNQFKQDFLKHTITGLKNIQIQ